MGPGGFVWRKTQVQKKCRETVPLKSLYYFLQIVKILLCRNFF